MFVEKEYTRRHKGKGFSGRLGLHFRDFHKLTMKGDYEYPGHRHFEYELIYVEKGPYRCSLNEIELVVSDNKILIIKPGDVHQDHLVDGQLHYVLHFTMDLPLFKNGVTSERQLCSGEIPDGKRFFDELETEEHSGDGFGGCLQDALLEVFFWRIVRLFDMEGLSPALRDFTDRQRFLRLLENSFEKNFSHDTSVDEFASELSVSRRTLSYRCREYLGCSPARAFMNYRLAKAASMLRNTDDTIQQISFSLGFENQFHFSRAFKRIYGTSPSLYRRE